MQVSQWLGHERTDVTKNYLAGIGDEADGLNSGYGAIDISTENQWEER